jgi:hypothetical protein
MRRVFKTKAFSRWTLKAGLNDAALCDAVIEMSPGLIDAELGGSLVKKRIALAGRGKRGSARTLIATNKGSRWFFIFGFEKNERDNIEPDELKALKQLARDLLKLTEPQLAQAETAGVIKEICNGHDKTH